MDKQDYVEVPVGVLDDIIKRSVRRGRIGIVLAATMTAGAIWGTFLLSGALERSMGPEDIISRFPVSVNSTSPASLKKEVEGALASDGSSEEEPDAAVILRSHFEHMLDNLGVMEAFAPLSNRDEWADYVQDRDGTIEFALDMAMLRRLGLVCFAGMDFQATQLTRFGYELVDALEIAPISDFEVACPDDTIVTDVTELASAPDPNGTQLIVDSGRASANGAIENNNRIDWYRVVIDEPGSYIIRTGPHLTELRLDTVVRLLDEAGVEIGYDDDGGPGTYSELREDLAVGEYDLGIFGFGGDTGHYRLEIVGATIDLENKEAERRALREGALILDVGGVVNGVLDGENDIVYKLVIMEGSARLYTITTEQLHGQAAVDTVVRLYRYEDGREELIGADDDSGDAGYSRLRENLDAGEYYIHVSSYWGSSGNFGIVVE